MLTTLRANRNLAVFLISIVLMEVAHGIEAMALFPLYLTEVLGSSVTLVGAVISTYLIVDIVTRTPAGWLADRWGRKAILVVGIVLSVVPLPLMMRVQDAHVFLLLNAVNGLGAGCIWPAIYAGVADTYQRSQRGLIMGILSTVMLGGLALGPISGNLLLGFTSYQTTFLACVALVCVALLLVLFLVKETAAEHEEESRTAAMGVLRQLTRELALLGMVALLLTVSLALLLPIISLYGAEILLVDKVTMGVLLAVPGGITALVLLPAGHLADRLGRKPLIVVGLALLTGCYAAAPTTINLVVVAAGATLMDIINVMNLNAFAPGWAGKPKDMQGWVIQHRTLGPVGQGHVHSMRHLGSQFVEGQRGNQTDNRLRQLTSNNDQIGIGQRRQVGQAR